MKFTFVIQDMSWLWDYKSQFSLGILYLSTQLKKAGHQVNVYDSMASDIEKIPYADIFAFSAVYHTYQSSVKLAKAIRKKHPDSKIIIGGVHPTTDPDNIDPIFDTRFQGQSELTILEYCKDFEMGQPKRDYISCGVGDLDQYYPDRSLMPIDYIRTKSIFTGGKMYDAGGSTSIMFSRGCPYRCAFCASPVVYKNKFAYRSIDNIINEVDDIIKTYGIKQFRVQDDTFTASKKFTEELCEKLKPFGIYYRCSTRVNHVTEEIIGHLYESGCREIGLGLEVADNEALKILNKKITIEQAEEAIRIIKKFPIMVRGFFMIGLPTDSWKTIQANIDFIERTGLDNVMTGNFIPLPGNEMYLNMPKYHIKSVKENTTMSFGTHLPCVPNIYRDDIDHDEHCRIMKKFQDYLVYKKFI